jgi:Ca2+-binding EF-hand superfamily protein
MKEYMNDADELKLDDEEAMEFHYFKLHDYDTNNKMDGLELGAAMTHYHDTDSGGEEKIHSIDISDEELSNLIDSILRDDDLNVDGYIDYYEFVQAQRKNRHEDV